MKKTRHELGTVRAPDSKRGLWEIDTLEIVDNAALYMANFRYVRDGYAYCVARPGTYRRLTHEQHGVVMSTTPMERNTCSDFVCAATGRVFVTGLGLGMVLDALLAKPEVTFIRVVELDPDLIELVKPHYKTEIKTGRLEIVQGDAFEYVIPKGELFDFGWHDIWNFIDSDNLPSMAKLVRRYSHRIKQQHVWSRPELYAERRRSR